MLSAGRSLTRFRNTGAELPRVHEFRDLYALGLRPRAGQVIMVSGRSGSGKSAFAMFWAIRMGLRTLYVSADMSPHTAATRAASVVTGVDHEEIASQMLQPDMQEYYSSRLADLPLTFSFGAPITWQRMEDEIDAHIELWDEYPEVIVIDNLKEFEGAESEYAAQMETMAGLTDLARSIGCTLLVLHHSSDKSWDAQKAPYKPPSRDEIKNGLSENPELSLSVAYDPNKYQMNVAIIKQRDGRSDPTAREWAELGANLGTMQFYAKDFNEREEY